MIDAQAMIDNSPEKNGGTIADKIAAAWAARAARYPTGRLAKAKAETAAQLAAEVRNA